MKTTTFLLLKLVVVVVVVTTIVFVKLDYYYNQLPTIQLSIFVTSYMYGIRRVNSNKKYYYFGRHSRSSSYFLNKVVLFRQTGTIITSTGSTLTSTSTSTSKITSNVHCFNPNSASLSFTIARTITTTTTQSTLNQYQLHARSSVLQMTQQQQQEDNVFENSNTIELDSNGKRSLRRKLLGINLETTESSSTLQPQQAQQIRPKVVGHRGSIYDYLENTRAGFLKCVTDYQCDAIELDVFLLPKCNTLIVFHGYDGNGSDDPISGELTNYIIGENENENEQHHRRSIMDFTYNEVKLLQFNPNYKEFTCSKDIITNTTVSYIPTLEQVLIDLKNTNCQIKIELKGPNVVQPVIELVEQLQMTQQCTYSSFNFTMLQQLRILRPDKLLYPTGALFAHDVLPNDYIQQCSNIGANEIHIKYDVCTKHIIQQIHTAGFTSMVWLRGPIGMNHDIQTKYNDFGTTTTSEGDYEEDIKCYQILIGTGVQQICCNKPNLLLSILNQ